MADRAQVAPTRPMKARLKAPLSWNNVFVEEKIGLHYITYGRKFIETYVEVKWTILFSRVGRNSFLFYTSHVGMHCSARNKIGEKDFFYILECRMTMPSPNVKWERIKKWECLPMNTSCIHSSHSHYTCLTNTPSCSQTKNFSLKNIYYKKYPSTSSAFNLIL